MKKKMILICILGIIAIICIYYSTINNKVKLLTLGDGLASGMTAYNVNGYSYTDYLKDYFKERNNLQSYNNVFAEASLSASNLLENLKNNKVGRLNNKDITIQQAIKEANVIVLAIGIDELANQSLNGKITTKDLNNYYQNIEQILTIIKKITNQKVILIGLYQAYNLNDITKINQNLLEIANELDCEFLDISKVVNNESYYFNDTSYYLNYKGHKKLSEELIKII